MTHDIDAETDVLLRTALRIEILRRCSGLTKAQLGEMARSIKAVVSAEIGYLINDLEERGKL